MPYTNTLPRLSANGKFLLTVQHCRKWPGTWLQLDEYDQQTAQKYLEIFNNHHKPGSQKLNALPKTEQWQADISLRPDGLVNFCIRLVPNDPKKIAVQKHNETQHKEKKNVHLG